MKKRLSLSRSSLFVLGLILLFVDIFLQIYFSSVEVGVANFGISFGVFDAVGVYLGVFVFGLFTVWIISNVRLDNFFPLSLAYIFFGGLGNLLSRLFLGSVWDYVFLPFLPFWFNLSDVLITVGVASYILGCNGNTSSVRG